MKMKPEKIAEVVITRGVDENHILVRETTTKVIWGEKFCNLCGQKNGIEREERGFYDKETGKPIFQAVCLENPCEHNGHRWKSGFGFLRMGERCERCGLASWGPSN